ncbi:hypothetical protein K438DRAFT_1977155 [Mycena galopus ATCC 62051]|nr:hypothetical protein K438DRAFT_1977155 [Mycena galopus ATCC 62051]
MTNVSTDFPRARSRSPHYVRRAEYRGHRYSRSLSSSEDMYLPSASASNANGEYAGGRSGNAPRALPVPPGVSANSIAAAAGSYSAYAASGTSRNAGPPAHLNTAGTPEAGAWAAMRNVGGRAFMRMGEMGEEELRRMGAPPALRPAARALRHEVLASSSSMSLSWCSSISDDEGAHGNHSPFRRPGSTPDVRLPRVMLRPTRPQERRTPSHRRHPVASPFAPSSSSASFSSNAASSPFPPKYKQSPSASRYEYDYPTTTSTDDGRGRAIASPSPSPTGRFCNRRVKGMVRSFESSGSESGGWGWI